MYDVELGLRGVVAQAAGHHDLGDARIRDVVRESRAVDYAK